MNLSITTATLLAALAIAGLDAGTASAQTRPEPRPMTLSIAQIPDEAWGSDGLGTNHVVAVQSGDLNRLNLTQSAPDGLGNLARVAQMGSGNEIRLLQDGSDNVAVLEQTGDANRMQVEQTGDGNRLTWTQTGDHLSQPIVVMPGGMTLTITQTGPF